MHVYLHQGATVEPLKDASQRRSSSHYSVKYEPGNDGNVEWRGVSTLHSHSHTQPQLNVYTVLYTVKCYAVSSIHRHTDLTLSSHTKHNQLCW